MIRLDGNDKKEVTPEEKARLEKSKEIKNNLKEAKVGTYEDADAIQRLVKVTADIRRKMKYYTDDSRYDGMEFYKALYKALTGESLTETGKSIVTVDSSDFCSMEDYDISESEYVAPYGLYWRTFAESPVRRFIDSKHNNRKIDFVHNDTLDKLCDLAKTSRMYDEVLFLLCLYQVVDFEYVISTVGRVDFVSLRIANLNGDKIDYGTDGYKRVFLFGGAAYWYALAVCRVALRNNASLERYMADFICALKMIKDPSAFSTNLYLSKGFTIGRDVDFSGLDLDTSSMLCLVCGYYDYIVSSECDNSLAELFAEKIKDLLLYGYDCSKMQRIVGMNQYEDEVVCFIPSFAICVIEEYTNNRVIPSNNG